MMEAVRTSETSVDNHFTRKYNPEDNSEYHTRRRENLKSHKIYSANIIYLLFIQNRNEHIVMYVISPVITEMSGQTF
jgi:hypothetical protein